MADEANPGTLEKQHPLTNYVWATEARKYIHQRDEAGKFFFLDSWLSWELNNGEGLCRKHVVDWRGIVVKVTPGGRGQNSPKMDNSIVNVALCNLVLLDAALGSRVTDILPPALWPPLGPCVTNIDAPWTCLTKVNAGKISKLLPHLEMLMSAVVFSKSGLENEYSVHNVFDGSLTFLNITELTLWVGGPCSWVEVPNQVYPGPESKYELTLEEEVSGSEAMLRAFPKLTALTLCIHICPVLEAILTTFKNAPSLESINLVVRSEWVTKKIVGQYPLLMQPHWTQIPVTKILFVVFVGIEYTEFREDVFFFQLLLSNCSQTLEELEITELTGPSAAQALKAYCSLPAYTALQDALATAHLLPIFYPPRAGR
ncbi:hypothetical protein Fcan01_26862 [Folsomia candida]|uniref:Uncharacterized protein n=1 Tax=Folsomia candida TaxID=158441 RepID=A0A226CZW3_FOLCA|nr:hypothetical protein Fcan01_26862 [Folsomia candida]